MEHRTHYFASFSYGEEPRLFGGMEEVERELACLATAEQETQERLKQAQAAVKALNTLTLSGADAEARIRILTELSCRRRETEALLDELRERKALLKEEWEDACFYLQRAHSHS